MSREQLQALSALLDRRVTAVWIGEVLGVTEKTARNRLAGGLAADDVVALCRAAEANPVRVLVEMNVLTTAEVDQFADRGTQPLATADPHALIVELASRTMTTAELGEIIARRER